jgi:predicted NUDIX family NTP pyrophosphohydrolase
MGGPFWARKHEGAWSFPKGEHDPAADPLAIARREFTEETGQTLPLDDADLVDLGEQRQRGGKTVRLFAADLTDHPLDADDCRSNHFTIEWPPRSGRQADFPEIDRWTWVAVDDAAAMLTSGQASFLEVLVSRLVDGAAGPPPR